MSNMSFEEKVALVTGAGTGIGLATAQAFAEAGATTVLADKNETAVRDAAEALVKRGLRATAVRCDVSVEADVAALLDEIISKHGRLDAAFNNAGIINEHVPTIDTSNELWDRIMNTNLKGLFWSMKYELKQMVKQSSGAIVNCSSIGGLTAAPGLSAYTAAKSAVIGITRTTALEYVKQGIRINAVCPGMIDTQMGTLLTHGDPKKLAAMAGAAPIGRFGTPAEIASAVLWLSSPGASYVIGTALTVDGGYVAQ